MKMILIIALVVWASFCNASDLPRKKVSQEQIEKENILSRRAMQTHTKYRKFRDEYYDVTKSTHWHHLMIEVNSVHLENNEILGTLRFSGKWHGQAIIHGGKFDSFISGDVIQDWFFQTDTRTLETVLGDYITVPVFDYGKVVSLNEIIEFQKMKVPATQPLSTNQTIAPSKSSK